MKKKLDSSVGRLKKVVAYYTGDVVCGAILIAPLFRFRLVLRKMLLFIIIIYKKIFPRHTQTQKPELWWRALNRWAWRWRRIRGSLHLVNVQMFLLFTQCTGLQILQKNILKLSSRLLFYHIHVVAIANLWSLEAAHTSHQGRCGAKICQTGEYFPSLAPGRRMHAHFFSFKNLHLFTLLLISPLEEAYTHEYMACCWLSEPRSHCARGDAWRLTLKSYLLFGFSFVGSWHHSPPASRRLPRQDHGFVSQL